MRLAGVDDDRMGIGCGDGEVAPLHLKHFLHRRMQRLVVHHLERKQDVLGGDRMAVRKSGAPAQMKSPGHSVRRHLPRFRQARAVLLRGVVVVHQKSKQTIGDVGRRRVGGHHRVERLGVVGLGKNETSAMTADRRHLPDERLRRGRNVIAVGHLFGPATATGRHSQEYRSERGDEPTLGNVNGHRRRPSCRAVSRRPVRCSTRSGEA